MTPDWKRVESLFFAAVEIEDTAQRTAFLDRECADDDALRREVVELLDADAKSFLNTTTFVQRAAADLIASPTPSLIGATLKSFKFKSLLGKGGMGEVYLADDTRMGRKVAVKVLPPSFIEDRPRLRRFRIEAKAALALNHPNIITIFEIGEENGLHYIVTEYVEGETLRVVIKNDELTLARAVDIAIQMADALAAAHGAGIVHRDIKPENAMIRPDGYVKVLDFGLAKQTVKTVADHDLSYASTEPGLVMGTLGYMSPEQTRGYPVDARTDLFSLGVVLYEMISGRTPFAGETSADVMANILNLDPPPISELAADAPLQLHLILEKALRKSREERYQTAVEMREDLRLLKDLLTDNARALRRPSGSRRALRNSDEQFPTLISPGEKTAPPPAVPVPKQRFLVRWAAILAIVSILGLGTAGAFRQFRKPKPKFTYERPQISKIVDSGNPMGGCLSPDGQLLAYAGFVGNRYCLLVKQIKTGSVVEVAQLDGEQFWGISFSPDGNYLYLVSESNNKPIGGTLWRIPSLGGARVKLIEKINGTACFSPDGKLFVFKRWLEPGLGALFVANPDGGEERRIHLRRVISGHAYFGYSWTAEGDAIRCVFLEKKPEGRRWSVLDIPLDGSAERTVYPEQADNLTQVVCLPGGAMLLNLRDPGTQRMQIAYVGAPGEKPRFLTRDFVDYRAITTTADGSMLVALQEDSPSALHVTELGKNENANRVTNGFTSNGWVTWLPDRTFVASRLVNGAFDLYRMDENGNVLAQLTQDASIDNFPAATSDGKYIVFRSNRGGRDDLWRINATGGDLLRLTENGAYHPSLSPDGKWVYYPLETPAGWKVFKVSIDGGPSTAVDLDDGAITSIAISPDGKMAAYSLSRLGQPEFMVVRSLVDGKKISEFPAPTDMWNYFIWSPDGKGIIYNGNIAIRFIGLQGGPPKTIYDGRGTTIYNFALTPDGKHLVTVQGYGVQQMVLIRDEQ
jgi:serine/threonine protein kinase/Tol biopolymer transport system component